MAANTSPIFIRLAQAEWPATTPIITAANTAKDGTGTVATIFTADATEGSFLFELRARPTGTNTASVLRVFLNNGLTNATVANNCLYHELSLPATTLSEIAAQSSVVCTLNLLLPAGYKINCTLGTAVAAGWALSAQGGKL